MDSYSADPLVKQFSQAFEDATGSKIAKDRESGVAFERPDGTHRLDVGLRAAGPDGQLVLAVEMLRQAYPRDVRNAIWQLGEYLLSDESGDDVVPS